ncbi:hypothetical protein SA22_4036 [Salmonella enterica subsp. enterica serovar Agona str. 22.H.04]|uniref:Uncharacterized protein n=1 Tax=Salmonella agona (strain SL483) TaxID=454166 RepID=B5F3F2_SALA4|nr:hypothetical protein SeAg_B4705 [Salmonella enterica subsp. enterica serovar Agona str. SL483]EDZ29024.1 hypothetical protein SeW_A4874 [Salmonella enterica subsp. enterica serovar Weltevreden str. HI_N05-537]CCR03213.1 hypothetical protein SA73_4457 [Salmonella enterica subsp. enterica serovar Agona str. 73.H.09]CCR05579.1 hypothetical protein SA72_2147 [Salmonella enterica subsp. enterica serovar Agona str. 72.A.52]CCR12398.1 hypothetical protein SA71_4398 [Salmonella enterica subsp. enter
MVAILRPFLFVGIFYAFIYSAKSLAISLKSDDFFVIPDAFIPLLQPG